MRAYHVTLDREGAEWLAEEARIRFHRTNDHGWREIADELDRQMSSSMAPNDDAPRLSVTVGPRSVAT